ncbi:hypothetical protein LQF67_08305 [Tetragenococcus halophilus]|uniref:hypothetical protein n=1 Tax=Tetragenococcus halophilus TaxID=51669 RepID=UPI001F2C44B3|nr:hypothetical protein [Tetragenococcus halophilus]MCF1685590.1 hypothetical protein [Tetragenococcus halophilus]
MEEFKLTYKIGDLELKLKGSQEFIDKEKEDFLQKLPELIDLHTAQPIDPDTPAPDAEIKIDEKISSEEKENGSAYESIVEFLNAHDFSTQKETVLGMAYFIDCVQQNPPVITRKINALYDEARQKKPNTSDNLSRLAKSGDLMPISGSKNSYKLTKQGMDTVDQRRK